MPKGFERERDEGIVETDEASDAGASQTATTRAVATGTNTNQTIPFFRKELPVKCSQDLCHQINTDLRM
jgi:hypothetical protein